MTIEPRNRLGAPFGRFEARPPGVLRRDRGRAQSRFYERARRTKLRVADLIRVSVYYAPPKPKQSAHELAPRRLVVTGGVGKQGSDWPDVRGFRHGQDLDGEPVLKEREHSRGLDPSGLVPARREIEKQPILVGTFHPGVDDGLRPAANILVRQADNLELRFPAELHGPDAAIEVPVLAKDQPVFPPKPKEPAAKPARPQPARTTKWRAA